MRLVKLVMLSPPFELAISNVVIVDTEPICGRMSLAYTIGGYMTAERTIEGTMTTDRTIHGYMEIESCR